MVSLGVGGGSFWLRIPEDGIIKGLKAAGGGSAPPPEGTTFSIFDENFFFSFFEGTTFSIFDENSLRFLYIYIIKKTFLLKKNKKINNPGFAEGGLLWWIFKKSRS